MGRARRARKIAATAAYGGGGIAALGAALGAAGWGVIQAEAALARRVIGAPFDDSPDDNGTYGSGRGEPYDVVVLGDSSAAGMGAEAPHETVGAIVASGVAALTGRRVRLTNRAVVGAESSDLERQLANALEDVLRPDVVLIMVGANDVTHRIERSASVRQLEQTVRRIRALGSEVVVGTCPDLGTIQPIRQPLRSLMKRWSRDLAAAQTVAVVEAGGRTVSLGDLIGPEFAESRTRCSARTDSTRRRPATPERPLRCSRACAPRWLCGAPTPPTGPPNRGAVKASGRSPWRRATRSRSPAPRCRRPRSPARPVGRAGGGRSRCGGGATACRRRRTPPSRPRARVSGRARMTRSRRRRPEPCPDAAFGRGSCDYWATMASSSTSTFQRGSTSPATTTIVLAGRMVPKISPCTDDTASTSSASPSVM